MDGEPDFFCELCRIFHDVMDPNCRLYQTGEEDDFHERTKEEQEP